MGEEKLGFIGNFSITFLTQITALLIGVINTVVIARNLGPESQGVMALVTTTASILVLCFGFGLQFSNVYVVGRNKEKLNQIFSNSLFILLLSFVFLFSIYNLFLRRVLNRFLINYIINIVLISVPFIMLMQFNQSILLGLQEIKRYNLVSIMRVMLLMCSNIILVILFRKKINTVLIGWLVSVALTAAISFKLILERGARLHTNFLGGELLKNSIAIGTKAFAFNMLGILLLRSDIYLIRYFRGNSDVGCYSIAALLAELMLIAPQVAGQLILAKASANEKGSCLLTARINRMSIFYSLIFAMGIIIFGRFALKTLFGDKFTRAYLSILLLLPGFIAMNSGSTVGYYITGNQGYPVKQILAALIGLIVNFSMNIILIPIFGIAGAAISSSVAYILYALLFCKFFQRLSALPWKDFLMPRIEDFHLKI